MLIEKERKRLNGFSSFIQSHIKNTIPENFPKPGCHMTLELAKKSCGTVDNILVLLEKIDKRTLFVTTNQTIPSGYSKNGRLFCTFDNNNFGINPVRQYTNIKIVGITKNVICIKLVDALFDKVNEREFKRVTHKSDYNISIKSIDIPEKNEKCRKYNLYIKKFIENLIIKDISAGGIGILCHEKHSDLIKENGKINVKILFGKRVEYRFFDRMIKSQTVPKILQTSMTVRIKRDEIKGVNYMGFEFEHIEKNRNFIIDTINRILQSEAAIDASLSQAQVFYR